MLLFNILLRFICWLLSLLRPTASTVKLGGTTLKGLDLPRLGLEFFGGIPFAEPPLGKLRFSPPVLKTTYGVASFDASKFGAACLQPTVSLLPSGPNHTPVNLHCLTISILRPAGLTKDAALPSMVFLHGGGFLMGASSQYNGSAIVTHSMKRGTPILYVTFNYRLGPFGFPQGKEAASRQSLNLGLKDQLAALQWMQEHISAFGGDRTKVTLFGESAGAISIADLYFNAQLETYIRGAIFQSGGPATTIVFDPERRESEWETFVRAVPDCAFTLDAESPETFPCMQGASSRDLLRALNVATRDIPEQFPWVPTIDGELLPELPSNLLAKGTFSNIPYISGTTLDEATFFVWPYIDSEEAIIHHLLSNFSNSPETRTALEKAAERLFELYPDVPALGCPFNTGNETFGLSSQYKRSSAMYGDIMFQSQRRAWMQATSSKGVKSYGYLLTDAPPDESPPIIVPEMDSGRLGVYHGLELYYIYGVLPELNSPAASVTLGTQMMDYWISFATSLDPNDGLGSERPAWPAYTSGNQLLLQLEASNTTSIPDDYREEQIAFLNARSHLFRH
ncbi:esterase 1 [Mycena sp. CBHHK59/15]|nr:esterase 1 [Mycena sp. CBHHK59/15]